MLGFRAYCVQWDFSRVASHRHVSAVLEQQVHHPPAVPRPLCRGMERRLSHGRYCVHVRPLLDQELDHFLGAWQDMG